MFRIFFIAIVTCSLMACETIPNDSSDTTPPTLALHFVGANAVYEDGSPVAGPIDFLRRPTVQTGQGHISFALLAGATDEQSGIAEVSLGITITGTCEFNFLGNLVTEPLRIPLGKRFSPELDDGEAPVTSVTSVSVNPREIWQRSRCNDFSDRIGHVRGTLKSLVFSYVIGGRNRNRMSHGVSGEFESEDIRVSFPLPRPSE